MNAIKRDIALALTALIVAGCQIGTSSVPLASSDHTHVDTSLIGLWQSVSDSDERVLILPFNEHEYYVEVFSAEPDSTDARLRYRTFTTYVAGAPFWNMQLLGLRDGEESYFLARYHQGEDGNLSFRYVNESLLRNGPQTSDDLYRIVREHMLDDETYTQDSLVYTRVRD